MFLFVLRVGRAHFKDYGLGDFRVIGGFCYGVVWDVLWCDHVTSAKGGEFPNCYFIYIYRVGFQDDDEGRFGVGGGAGGLINITLFATVIVILRLVNNKVGINTFSISLILVPVILNATLCKVNTNT